MNCKAQAGLEYLVTYGWALVLVAAIVGVFAFVVIAPTQDASFSSSDPTKLMVKAASIANGQATIKLQNITGGEIRNINVSPNPNYQACTISAEEVPAGGEITIICKVVGEPTGSLDVTFTDNVDLTQEVTVSGGGPIPMSPGGETICDDTLDNDFDGDVDCADSDCVNDPDCQSAVCGDGQLDDGEWCDGDLGLPDTVRLECVDCAKASIMACGVSLSKAGDYILTGQIVYDGEDPCISISADNISLDCQDNIMRDSRTITTAIYNSGNDNLTVQNCKIRSFMQTLILRNADNQNILNNEITCNDRWSGIESSNLSNSNLSNNTVAKCAYSFIISGTGSNNQITGNTVSDYINGFRITSTSGYTISSNTACGYTFGEYDFDCISGNTGSNNKGDIINGDCSSIEILGC